MDLQREGSPLRAVYTPQDVGCHSKVRVHAVTKGSVGLDGQGVGAGLQSEKRSMVEKTKGFTL